MKTPNERKLKQVASRKLYKKCAPKRYSFLFNDNHFHFRFNLLERIKKVIMTIDEKIRDKNYNTILTEKQQKYQHYHQANLTNLNILQGKIYYRLIKVK